MFNGSIYSVVYLQILRFYLGQQTYKLCWISLHIEQHINKINPPFLSNHLCKCNSISFSAIGCTECQCCHGPECPNLGGLPAISDTPIQSKAIATLPSSLKLQVDNNGTRKVVAGQKISCRTQFGPIDAPVTTENEVEDAERSSGRLLVKVWWPWFFLVGCSTLWIF